MLGGTRKYSGSCEILFSGTVSSNRARVFDRVFHTFGRCLKTRLGSCLVRHDVYIDCAIVDVGNGAYTHVTTKLNFKVPLICNVQHAVWNSLYD